MTVPNYYPDAVVAVTEPVRFLGTIMSVNNGKAVSFTLDPTSYRGLAEDRRRAARLGYDFTYEPLPQRTTYVPGCPWCGVRPLLFEMDCDGPASKGTCGSPQCDQLKRCETCGVDGIADVVSGFGHQCRACWHLSFYGTPIDQDAAATAAA